ncbi:hypothetical protein WN982_25430 [Paraburkholderia sp. IMGN_8]|uniref:hypothetical protein n=1 Tax=Paraburkholderia sp. IMGN_8 TaxID=3136564 RepID=UPI003101AEBD
METGAKTSIGSSSLRDLVQPSASGLLQAVEVLVVGFGPVVQPPSICWHGTDSGPQIKERADSGIAVMLPKPTTSGANSHGRFDRADFIYDGWWPAVHGF